jgi:hypothetical protein
MRRSSSLFAPAVLVLAALMTCLSGCVVHDRGYSEGYREGYYDREHNRYWHEQAWHDCVADDPHCH